MPRTNIPDRPNGTQESEKILNLAYSRSSTVGEIIEGIKTLRNNGRNIGDNQSLKEVIEFVLDLYGKKIRDFENWEEINKFLGDLPSEETIKAVEDELKSNEEEETEKDKFESRALNAKELEALLEAYEKHNSESLEKIAQAAAKNPLLAKYKTQELIKQISAIYKIDTEKRSEGKPVAKSIEETKATVITEARIRDAGIEPEKADKLTKIIQYKTAKDVAVTKEDVIEVLGEIKSKAETEKIENVNRVLEIARLTIYEKKVDNLIETITQETVNQIESTRVLNKEQKESIKKILKEDLQKKANDRYDPIEPKTTVGKLRPIIQSDEPTTTMIAVETGFKTLGQYKERNEEMFVAIEQQHQFDSIWHDFQKHNPEATPEQVKTMREYSVTIAKLPLSGLENYQKTAIEHTAGQQKTNGEIITRTQAEQQWINLDQGMRTVRGGKETLLKLANIRKNLKDVNIPVENKYLRPVDTIAEMVSKDPNLARVIETVTKKIEFFNNFYNGVGYKVFVKVGGEKAVSWLAGKIGGDAGRNLAETGLEILAKQGFSEGIKNVFIQLATKAGINLAADATVSIAGGEVISAILGTTNPVGWIVTAAMLTINAWSNAFKQLDKLRKDVVTYLQIEIFDYKGWAEKEFGKAGAAVVTITSGFMTVVGSLGAALTLPFLVPVVTFVFIGIATFQLISGGQVSSIKPPEGMGGGKCVLKSDGSSSGSSNDEVNCNPKVSDKSVGGLDKNSYETKVNTWDKRGGTNAAKKCFNDVVCRANTAGINPKLALTIWLSESAASNYAAPRTGLDFGINVPSVAPPKNFNKQIQAFFNQPQAMLGQCGSQHSGTQTEKFIATYVRTEAGACPDPQSGKGKEYLDYIRTMYQFLFGEDLPSSPFVDKQSGDCSLDYTGDSNSSEITDQNGSVWICDNTSSSGDSASVASSLEGMNGGQVEGECSTAGAAISDTYNQCKGPWANIKFPSGSGTVCSAGCGPTSASMIVSRKDGSCTPDQMVINNSNCAGDAYAGITNNGSGIDQNVNAINHAFPGSTHAVGCSTPQEIADFICKGNKVVEVLADFFIDSAGHYGGHYFLAVGVNNGQIVVKDPYWVNDHHFDGQVQAGSIAKIYSCILIDADMIK